MTAHARSLHGRSRSLTITAVLLVALAVLAGAVVWATRGNANATQGTSSNFPSAKPASSGDVVTTAGSVSKLDIEFLKKVRQANLWEAPAGRLAQTHATSESVKRAGLHIMEGHASLDEFVRNTAEALNVSLPDVASEEQLGFVRTLENAEGADFDKKFSNILRGTHGKIFVTIAQVRASTKNSLIRRFASEVNRTVLDHQNVLDDSGLVDEATFDDMASTF
jgi:predicted outer membrane protein